MQVALKHLELCTRGRKCTRSSNAALQMQITKHAGVKSIHGVEKYLMLRSDRITLRCCGIRQLT
jgi:hypothetical protein